MNPPGGKISEALDLHRHGSECPLLMLCSNVKIFWGKKKFDD